MLVIVIVAGCVVLCSHAAGFAVCFWCSSANWFYFWWLRFGFRTLACSFAIMVRLLASASLSACAGALPPCFLLGARGCCLGAFAALLSLLLQSSCC